MTDEPVKDCPECKGQVARVLFAPGIVFKGSGFHINDYPSSGSSSAPRDGSKPETPSEPKADTKTETKAEPAAAAKS